MPAIKPDYSQHDDVYVSLRKGGAVGWSSQDEYEVMKDLVAPFLPAATGGQRLLELGSGAGNFSVVLAQLGYDVTGVEISATAVEWAKERASAAGALVHFQVDSVVELASCASGSFDIVVDGHCLHCIVGDDRARCFESIRRVLKPGGVLVVLTMFGEVLDERLLEAFDPMTRTVAFGGRPSRHIGTAESITAEVKRAGFQVDVVQVHPRKEAREQDDLIMRCVLPA